MKIIAAIIFAFIAAVSAQVTITSPNSDSVFVAGQDAVITWQTTTTATMDITLMRLIFGSYAKVITIGTNIDPASGSFTWSVPTTLTTPLDSDIYKVLFNSTDLAPNGYLMDGFFTIASASNAPTSSNPPSSSAAPSPSPSPVPSSSSATSSSSSSSAAATSASSGSTTASDAANTPGSSTGTSSNADETATSGDGDHNDGLGTGAIAGIAVGSVGGVGLIALVGVLFCVYRRREKRKQGGNTVAESRNAGPAAEESYQTRSFVPPYVITTGQERYSAQYVPPSNGYTPDQQYYTDVPHSQAMEYRNDVPHSAEYTRQDVPHSVGTEYPPQVPHSVNPEYYGRQHIPHTLETEQMRYDRPNYQG